MMAAGATVLIVDDDDELRESVSELLADEGYQTASVENGAQALSYLRASPARPDLILLDLMMPVMSGWQFREEQLRDPTLAAIPVVVMTANRNLHDNPISADEVISKPLKLARLLDVIQRHVKLRNLSASSSHHGEERSPFYTPQATRATEEVSSALSGGGKMGALMRAVDWAKTPVGPEPGWPQSLRTALGVLLETQFPMYLAWGPAFTQFYNDAYRTLLGDAKHPSAGRSTRETFPEHWDTLEPMFERVRQGQGVFFEDYLVPMNRYGFLEEAYASFSYSPIRDESGGVGGVLVIGIDTTPWVIGQRRLRTLRDLAAGAVNAKTVEATCESAMQALGANAADLPFGLLYLLDKQGKRARLARTSGLPPGTPASPPWVDLADSDAAGWPLGQVARSGQAAVVADLAARFGPLPGGQWPEPTAKAVVLPILHRGHEQPHGLLVLGVSPRLLLDETYRGFHALVAEHFATAIANARAHEEERARAEGLAEMDRARTAFFSNVSHEFRTPLTLMLGPTEDLLAGAHGPLTEAQREPVELVRRNALRLQKLVNSLLDFSRIEAGRAQALYEPTDLARLTTELASGFRAATERAGIRLAVDCPPLPEPVQVDREMWEKIVLNLLSNAFKFTLEGTISVCLRAAGDHVELAVSDTGAGIPEAEMASLSKRFHRVPGARSRTHEGSGIGLSLVHELVRLHGGTVAVASELDKGSTFTVSLPFGSAHLPQDRLGAGEAIAAVATSANAFVEEALHWLPGAPSSGRRPDPASTLGSDARILVADDNADMRGYICRLLGERWMVEAVADGRAALEAARERAPDLFLADVMMPGLDGFQLLRDLRADPRTRGIPIVLLSARAGEEAIVEGLEAGADDYLMKPFSARELMARVSTQLKLSRVRVEAEQERAREREQLIESLQSAVRFSEMFLGVVGHDLRSPLSAIQTSAHLLLRRAGTEAVAAPAARIHTSAERMGRMIEQLLDFTRLRIGRGIELARTRVDLGDICCTVIEELESGEGPGDVRLSAAGDLTGLWDGDRVSQLVSNLVGNAIQHSEEGTKVSVRLDGRKPDVVVLEVRNAGALPAWLLPVVFEPFHGGHTRLQKKSSGLGLGLFITQQIALAHGGRIDVVSSETSDTSFTVELPRAIAAPRAPTQVRF
jgi:signal transduction histidine kinase